MKEATRSVAFLLGNLTLGGSESKTVRLANRLSREGADVHILAIGPPYTLRDRIAPTVNVALFDRDGAYSLRILRRIRSYLARHGISTVMCVNTYPLVFGWPAGLMRGPARHLVATINTYELPSRRDRLFMILYAFLLRRCDRIVFGSRRQADAWIDRYGLDRDRAVVVYNGVDTAHFSPGEHDAAPLRQALGIEDNACVVGCVAQLRPEKQQQVLLQAAAQVREKLEVPLAVVLVGDGPEADKLKRVAADCGLERHVHFVGAVEDVRPYLSLFDAFVLPSASEVFSNAVLEAMAMRVPVIASDAGGSGEMIEHGKGGFVYPPGDVEQLGRLLYEVLTDTQLADRFREAAAARIRADFSLQRMQASYAEALWSGRE